MLRSQSIRRIGRPALILSAGFAAAAVLAAGATPAHAGGGSDPAVADPSAAARSTLKQLVTDTRQLPRAAATPKSRSSLLRLATQAKRAVKRKPCRSVKLVGKYRRGLGKVRAKGGGGRRPGPASARGVLETDAFAADAALKQLRKTRRCGGGAVPGAETLEVSISNSDTQTVDLSVALPRARWEEVSGRGEDFTALEMDGAEAIGDPGDPGVPVFTELVAVPQGANVSVDVSNVESYTLEGVDLFPKQEEAVDGPFTPPENVFADPPFKINPKAFKSGAPVPATPSSASRLGTMRDLGVGGVQIAGAQFFPRQKKLEVFTRIEAKVEFGGANTGTWRTQKRRSVFERAFSRLYNATLKNYGTVAKDTGDPSETDQDAQENATPEDETVEPCGEDMLVVTSAALRPAADTFADARRAAGLVVAVKETGTSEGQIGTENAQIRSFIRGEINNTTCTRPTYVVLLGDTSHVPTFIEPCTGLAADTNGCPVPSDLSYSLDGIGNDPFADVLLGRIPANTLEAANTSVQKIIGYETTLPAPAGDDFYNHATVTAAFEGLGPRDDRTFSSSSETVRAGLLSRGHIVDRLYSAQAAADIQEFKNGTSMPDELKRPGFPWTAGRTDLINAFNDGRFYLLHRDHGSRLSWANPAINVNDVPSLTNGTQLPVVFAINCSSGDFSVPGNPSFVERLLQHPAGGAVGGFADTEVSPTNPNSQLSIGFADALFPATVPASGGAEPLVTMGEVLNAGKDFMGNGAPAASQLSGNTYRERLLWHYLGDPSMQIWSATPTAFDPAQIQTVRQTRTDTTAIDDPAFRVQVTMTQPGTDGTIVTLRHAGEAIGRAIVQNGVALITPERRTDSGSLSIALEREGFLSREVPVNSSAPTHTIACPPVQDPNQVKSSGQITQGGGAIKDGLVDLRYTTPAGVSTTSVLTDENGNWVHSKPIGPDDHGTWKVEAFFDDKGVKDAVCEFVVP